MGAFDMLRIANSSLGMHQTWLDSLANNIANVNTAKRTSENAYQAQMVIAGARRDGGVEVAGIAVSDPTGRLVHDPTNALADAEGYVRLPEIDLADSASSREQVAPRQIVPLC